MNKLALSLLTFVCLIATINAISDADLKLMGVCKCNTHPFKTFVDRFLTSAEWKDDADIKAGLAFFNEDDKQNVYEITDTMPLMSDLKGGPTCCTDKFYFATSKIVDNIIA